MKKSIFLHLLFIIVTGMAVMTTTSCNNDDKNYSLADDWQTVLDNNNSGPFAIDKDGHCFGTTSITLEDVKNTIAGSGWKCYDSWEIDENGYRQKESYWENQVGGSPTQFYFGQDGTVREYFVRDAFPFGPFYKDLKWSWYDDKSSTTDRSRIIIGNSKDDYLQIIGWSGSVFCTIQNLSVSGNGSRNYGVSLYRKMTDKELKDYNDTYTDIILYHR